MTFCRFWSISACRFACSAARRAASPSRFACSRDNAASRSWSATCLRRSARYCLVACAASAAFAASSCLRPRSSALFSSEVSGRATLDACPSCDFGVASPFTTVRAFGVSAVTAAAAAAGSRGLPSGPLRTAGTGAVVVSLTEPGGRVNAGGGNGTDCFSGTGGMNGSDIRGSSEVTPVEFLARICGVIITTSSVRSF